jgi:hypothetical protein
MLKGIAIGKSNMRQLTFGDKCPLYTLDNDGILIQEPKRKNANEDETISLSKKKDGWEIYANNMLGVVKETLPKALQDRINEIVAYENNIIYVPNNQKNNCAQLLKELNDNKLGKMCCPTPSLIAFIAEEEQLRTILMNPKRSIALCHLGNTIFKDMLIDEIKSDAIKTGNLSKYTDDDWEKLTRLLQFIRHAVLDNNTKALDVLLHCQNLLALAKNTPPLILVISYLSDETNIDLYKYFKFESFAKTPSNCSDLITVVSNIKLPDNSKLNTLNHELSRYQTRVSVRSKPDEAIDNLLKQLSPNQSVATPINSTSVSSCTTSSSSEFSSSNMIYSSHDSVATPINSTSVSSRTTSSSRTSSSNNTTSFSSDTTQKINGMKEKGYEIVALKPESSVMGRITMPVNASLLSNTNVDTKTTVAFGNRTIGLHIKPISCLPNFAYALNTLAQIICGNIDLTISPGYIAQTDSNATKPTNIPVTLSIPAEPACGKREKLLHVLNSNDTEKLEATDKESFTNNFILALLTNLRGKAGYDIHPVRSPHDGNTRYHILYTGDTDTSTCFDTSIIPQPNVLYSLPQMQLHRQLLEEFSHITETTIDSWIENLNKSNAVYAKHVEPYVTNCRSKKQIRIVARSN